jgi:predicted transcriptional regulator
LSKLELHVGGGFAASKARVLDAVHRAEAGETVCERHLTVADWNTLAKVLTPKRMELLHHLRQRPASTVADLARVLDRDYKRVREDVEYLSDLGLVERDATGLRVDVDEIRAAIAI